MFAARRIALREFVAELRKGWSNRRRDAFQVTQSVVRCLIKHSHTCVYNTGCY